MPAPDSIRHLVATDRQVNQLVNQFYGLADDEIKLVESPT
jgi:hypothetical protein